MDDVVETIKVTD